MRYLARNFNIDSEEAIKRGLRICMIQIGTSLTATAITYDLLMLTR